MTTAGTILDQCYYYLHDDATVWSRAELLDYLNQGYRKALLETNACRGLTALATPPRPYVSITYPWERQYARGIYYEWSYSNPALPGLRCCYQWEIEHHVGTPASCGVNYTSPWERVYSDDGVPDQTERYHYPVGHYRTYRVAFDDESLDTESVRSLDGRTSQWETETGDPSAFNKFYGSTKEFTLYAQVTGDGQSHTITGDYGTVRGLSGDRTYTIEQAEYVTEGYAYTCPGDLSSSALTGPGYRFTTATAAADYWCTYSWEANRHDGDTETDQTDNVCTYAWELTMEGYTERTLDGLGTIRTMESDARQYYASSSPLIGEYAFGVPRYWQDSSGNILVDYSVVAPDLKEADEPNLLPAAFAKYLRYFVLSLAFLRDGEGRNPTLAQHFSQRFQMGVTFLARIGKFASRARAWQHGESSPSPGRKTLRLGSHYPRVYA